METNYFATNLKYLRQKYNMEQLELAHRLGRKSSSSISEWEKGRYTPKAGILNDIATIFNIPLTKLMNEDLTSSNETILDKIANISSKLDEDRQQVVLETAQDQHKEQEAERKAKKPIPLHMDDEAIYGHIDRAAAWQGEELTEEDRDAIMIALKKHLEEKAKEESEKGK